MDNRCHFTQTACKLRFVEELNFEFLNTSCQCIKVTYDSVVSLLGINIFVHRPQPKKQFAQTIFLLHGTVTVVDNRASEMEEFSSKAASAYVFYLFE